MKRKYIELNRTSKTYIELSKNQNIKVTPMKNAEGNLFCIEELLMVGDRPIYFYFVCNRFGKAIFNVFNTYFGMDDKETFNQLGWIEYKMQLLNRIQCNLLEKKQSFILEDNQMIR